jgi:hypothetical protein
MNKMKVLAVGAVALLLTGSSAFAEVQLSIQNGRVSLVAKDATVRQILTEWARVGQTKILNVERIPGGPLTLELTDVPEQEALDVLLRSISGYMAAPRAMASANLSRFDRIVVMPTTAPPRSAAASTPAPTFAQPQFQPPQFQAPPAPEEDADDERPAPNGPVPNPRGPIFNTFPQPQVVNPQMNPNGVPPGVGNPMQPGQVPQQVAPSAYPTAPSGGVAIPGMVAPAPLQPGQVPGQPGQPVRRPGGPEGSESQ